MAKFHWFPLRFGDLSLIFPPKSCPGRTIWTQTGYFAPENRIFHPDRIFRLVSVRKTSRTGNFAPKNRKFDPDRIFRPTQTGYFVWTGKSDWYQYEKQHDSLHRFGHNFWFRTPFWVFFGSFRSYERHLQHQHGRSLFHSSQNSWASTKVSTIWLKIAGLRYKNFAILPPLAFLC